MFNFIDEEYNTFAVVFLSNRAYFFEVFPKIVIEADVDFVPEVELPIVPQMVWL